MQCKLSACYMEMFAKTNSEVCLMHSLLMLEVVLHFCKMFQRQSEGSTIALG